MRLFHDPGPPAVHPARLPLSIYDLRKISASGGLKMGYTGYTLQTALASFCEGAMPILDLFKEFWDLLIKPKDLFVKSVEGPKKSPSHVSTIKPL